MNDVKKIAEKSRDQIKELVKERPIESSVIIFFIGFVLGILFGETTSKRS